jgi:hypothetical protein
MQFLTKKDIKKNFLQYFFSHLKCWIRIWIHTASSYRYLIKERHPQQWPIVPLYKKSTRLTRCCSVATSATDASEWTSSAAGLAAASCRACVSLAAASCRASVSLAASSCSIVDLK